MYNLYVRDMQVMQDYIIIASPHEFLGLYLPCDARVNGIARRYSF